MTDPILRPLEPEEERFIYNLDVMGLPASKAASLAGVSDPAALLAKPHIAHYREVQKRTIRAKTEITREDVIAIVVEAIDMGRLIARPDIMINGAKELNRMLGYDAAKKIDLNVMNGSGVPQELRAMTLDEVLQLAGKAGAIDADFTEVRKQLPPAA